MRIGFGYDCHRFEEAKGKPLVLAGVVFEGACGLKAHSDGDVVLHALIDALLGAAALGDIGSHFPDSDLKWKGADSTVLLTQVVGEISAAGYRIGNVDITVICEQPKLRPHVEAMRASIAKSIGVDLRCVSIKGKTNERMDDVGAGVGIEVHAVALLEERAS